MVRNNLRCTSALLLAISLSLRSHGFAPVNQRRLSLMKTPGAVGFTATAPHPSLDEFHLPSRSSVDDTSSRRLATSLHTVAPAAAAAAATKTGFALAAITGAISGGLFAGGLHAIAGPDHLAALLPRCCGQRWYRAGRVGALWGMGHGVSATILGVLAFALKTTFSNVGGGSQRLRALLNGASHVTEIAVGLSLVLIGVMGIKEAREWEEEIDGVQPQSLSAAAADPGVKVSQKRAVIFNGLLHGFSWDGAPSLAPAVAVATWSGNLAFLSAYAVGTMAAMAVTTTLIGEGTRKAGQFFDRPDIPQKLSLVSSIVAIIIGVVWCGLAFL